MTSPALRPCLESIRCACDTIALDAAVVVRQAILFVDSKTALGTLLRGASRYLSVLPRANWHFPFMHFFVRPRVGRNRDWNELVGEIWLRAARQGGKCLCWQMLCSCAVRWEGTLLSMWWVPSHLNLADAPTRVSSKKDELRALQAAGFGRVPWRWPRHCPWLACKA